MIVLVAKFLLIIGIHIAIIVVWKMRTGAAWSALLFALIAFIIHYFGRIPLTQLVMPHIDLSDIDLILKIPASLFPQWFSYGLFREAVRWLTFRYLATGLQFWRDGVMFGIGYTTIAMLLMLWGLLSEQTIEPGLTPPSLFRRAMILKDSFLWVTAIILAWQWSIPTMIVNVGTSLAVLFSVRQRQAWPLLAAVLIYVLQHAAPWFAVLYYIPDVQIGGLERILISTFWREFIIFIATLPALCLIFLLRKPLGRTTQLPAENS